jgi:hypothetical protein
MKKTVTRAAWLVAALVVLGAASTAFAPPIGRPAPRPPAPPPRPVIVPPQPGPGAFQGRPGRPGRFVQPKPMVTPRMVRDPILKAIESARPAEAIRHLNADSARLLPQAERLQLGQKALRGLALSVEAGGKAWESLAEVRTARRNANEVEPAVKKDLDALHQRAERQALIEVVADVQARAERGQWGEAALKAREVLPRLQEPVNPEVRAQETADFQARRLEVRKALNDLVTVGQRLEALDQLQAGVKALEGNRSGEAARALTGLNVDLLPAKAQAPARALRGLAEVRALAEKRWGKAPDVAALKEGLARFRDGLAGVPGADPMLVKKIAQDLAVKALLEGHPAEYRSLMPADGPPEHAANLLRDITALALGEGKVTTWPAESVLATPEPGAGPASPRGPPPGLKPLIPEGPSRSWRPPVREAASAGLPPLEKAVEAAAPLRASAEAESRGERTNLNATARTAQASLGAVQQRILLPEKAERQAFAEVEAALDRRLAAAERVTVREMVAQNKAAKEIVAVFQAQPAPNDDEELFKELKALLGGELTEAQRAQALRLRKAGRKVAEIADVMRRQ